LDGSKNPGGKPKVWTDGEIEALGDRMLTWALSGPMTFYIAQFIESEARAGRLVHKQRISEFEAGNEKFAELCKVVKNILESHFGTAGAGGLIPPVITVFGLKQHGHTDKQEVAHSGEIAQTHRYEMPNPRPIE
jgi:hypothetical protein